MGTFNYGLLALYLHNNNLILIHITGISTKLSRININRPSKNCVMAKQFCRQNNSKTDRETLLATFSLFAPMMENANLAEYPQL